MSTQKYPARFEFLDEVRDHVAAKARQGGFGERAVYSVQLAADEAASNIIEHAYDGLPDGSFRLRCECSNDGLIMTFLDHGRPFDMTKVEKPDVTADLSARKIGGLGVYLMHKLMDQVAYKVTRSGNFLSLIKQKE
jgi:serine/threonine-protein kinase RsbW